MTESELLLEEIEKLFRPIMIKGKGIDFGPDNRPITAKELQTCEMLTIESYKGFEIKVIIKRL